MLQLQTLASRVSVNHAETYIACSCAGLGLIQVPAFDVQEHLAAGTLTERKSDLSRIDTDAGERLLSRWPEVTEERDGGEGGI